MLRFQSSCKALICAFVLAVAFCCFPAVAFAGGEELAAGATETQSAPTAKVSYAVGTEGSWAAQQSDDAVSAVASGKFVQALKAKVQSSVSGSIQYQAYLHGYGWQKAKSNGAVAGAAKQGARRVEAVRFALTGELSKWYDVQYSVRYADGTWQAAKVNGQTAGAAGKKIDAIQVSLVAKEQASDAAGDGTLGVRYRAKLLRSKWQVWKSNNEKAGKAGKGKRIQNFAIALDPGAYSGGIKYRVRLSNGKWKGWKKNGKAVGNYKNIEAIQIKLTGKVAEDFDVVYRTYASKVGWQSRVRNGATAGTGKNRRIEGLQVQIVSKSKRSGWVGSGTKWSYYTNGVKAVSKWITTTESPINVMTAKSHKYWIDSTGKLAVSRAIVPSVAKDAAAGQVSYATKSGYILINGKAKTSAGVVLADSKGVLATQTGWLKTTKYDDVTQVYWMVDSGGYSAAKTGFFKLNGTKYYGSPDEGYILRDATWKVGKKWYTADPDGEVGAATSAAVHIERYVQWAIAIANDDSHGYSQAVRWGPDYDCSSLVISALKNTGLSTGDAVYTGNMKSELTARGFKWHTNFSKLKRGDILLVHNNNRQHTEIYIGGGQTVGAHIAETGGIYGVAGDQTGEEICIAPYQSIWQGYLRFGS